MNNDIKEILKDMDLVVNFDKVPIFYTKDKIRILLDYITNLQKERNNLKTSLDESQEVVADYKRENDKLKEELKSANASITWWNNRYNALEKHNKKLNLEAQKYFDLLMDSENYKARCDKAIEYMNEEMSKLPFSSYTYYCGKLLNILQGDDKEWKNIEN